MCFFLLNLITTFLSQLYTNLFVFFIPLIYNKIKNFFSFLIKFFNEKLNVKIKKGI